MRVRQQHYVDIAEPAIGLVDGAAGIVEDAHAGRIFEEQGAIVAAQLACVAAEGRHLDQRCRLAGRHGAVRNPEQQRYGDDERSNTHDVLPTYRTYATCPTYPPSSADGP